MSNHLGHVDCLGSTLALHRHPDGQRSLSNDALTKAILFQLGKLGSGKSQTLLQVSVGCAFFWTKKIKNKKQVPSEITGV